MLTFRAECEPATEPNGLHVMVMAADLETFAHVHPEEFRTERDAAPRVVLRFPRPGRYLVHLNHHSGADLESRLLLDARPSPEGRQPYTGSPLKKEKQYTLPAAIRLVPYHSKGPLTSALTSTPTLTRTPRPCDAPRSPRPRAPPAAPAR